MQEKDPSHRHRPAAENPPWAGSGQTWRWWGDTSGPHRSRPGPPPPQCPAAAFLHTKHNRLYPVHFPSFDFCCVNFLFRYNYISFFSILSSATCWRFAKTVWKIRISWEKKTACEIFCFTWFLNIFKDVQIFLRKYNDTGTILPPEMLLGDLADKILRQWTYTKLFETRYTN